MRKYLELFKDGFDATIAEKIKPENRPYVGYSPSEGVVFTVIPKPVTGPANNEIWYTTTDGNVVNPYEADENDENGFLWFGAHIVSNTYEDGKGIILFDNDVTSIGSQAFYHCSSITSVTIPESVTSIGGSAFRDCSSLTSITIPNSVTSTHGYAFKDCTSLTYVTIPNSVTSIEDRDFDHCSSLPSITIPSSVTSIGDYAFGWCSSLNSITYEGTQDQWNAITKGRSWKYKILATYVQCSDGQVAL